MGSMTHQSFKELSYTTIDSWWCTSNLKRPSRSLYSSFVFFISQLQHGFSISQDVSLKLASCCVPTCFYPVFGVLRRDSKSSTGRYSSLICSTSKRRPNQKQWRSSQVQNRQRFQPSGTHRVPCFHQSFRIPRTPSVQSRLLQRTFGELPWQHKLRVPFLCGVLIYRQSSRQRASTEVRFSHAGLLQVSHQPKPLPKSLGKCFYF